MHPQFHFVFCSDLTDHPHAGANGDSGLLVVPPAPTEARGLAHQQIAANDRGTLKIDLAGGGLQIAAYFAVDQRDGTAIAGGSRRPTSPALAPSAEILTNSQLTTGLILDAGPIFPAAIVQLLDGLRSRAGNPPPIPANLILRCFQRVMETWPSFCRGQSLAGCTIE